MFLIYDFVPTFQPILNRRLKREISTIQTDQDSIERILNVSLEMISIGEEASFWNKQKGFNLTEITILSLHKLRHSIKQEFTVYNYPKGFLVFGIAMYLKNTEDSKRLLILKSKFDELFINSSGLPKFDINKVDQSPFAAASLVLYESFKEAKYLKFADFMYTYIASLEDNKTGLIRYREGSKVYFNDTLGMIIPFLVYYYRLTNNSHALDICVKQIDYFNAHGLDANSKLPCHGINTIKNNLKVGSANWGRGIGWYFYGLSCLNSVNNKYLAEIEKLKYILLGLEIKNGLWSQFPGSSERFDASTTTMILSSIALYDSSSYTRVDLIEKLSKYINAHGHILETSGDTIDLNRYSDDFGKSELSQGFLLLTLAYLKK